MLAEKSVIAKELVKKNQLAKRSKQKSFDTHQLAKIYQQKSVGKIYVNEV